MPGIELHADAVRDAEVAIPSGATDAALTFWITKTSPSAPTWPEASQQIPPAPVILNVNAVLNVEALIEALLNALPA